MARISSERISLFVLATGPRGACKTLLMSSKVCHRLIKQYYLRELKGVETGVWANYPVAFNFRSPLEGGKTVRLEARPLNMEAFYTFDDELTHGWVFIDEIDQWYDRQGWQSVTQKLMSSVLTQIRKRKLNLMATIQDPEWLNARGQFQMDLMVKCREAAFSRWGRRVGLDLGEASFVGWRDMSGVMTGYGYRETGRTYDQIFWGRRFWNTYDTDYEFNPLDTKVRYKLKMPTRVIEIGAGGFRRPDDADHADPLISARKDPDEVILAHVVEEYLADGVKRVSCRDLWKRAEESGLQTPRPKAGQVLAALGVVRSGSLHYNLEGVVVHA